VFNWGVQIYHSVMAEVVVEEVVVVVVVVVVVANPQRPDN
jgi:hypothetical protein